MSEFLHIVSLTAPSPPDYGGAFDLFYKVPALANLGKKIILHYFDYKEGRGHEGLEPYCLEINKYKRTGFLKSLSALKPYIVSSRIESKLIDRLRRDDYPVLLEGIHCTGIIPYLGNRKIIVRVHNDEAEYYRQLQQNEQNVFKNLYFSYESLLLSHYQKKLSKEPTFVFVSEKDKEKFEKKYHQKKGVFLPCFLPWQTIHSLTGKGHYCLYHGNLAISENGRAALWLAEKIFSRIDFPFIIAGKNASALKGRLPANLNLKLIENPSDQELSELITGAHINVLPSFNSTGVKLKLLHALFEGRFCVTNEAGIAGT
ncbi:MAG: glycosyltransferase, partial [Flavisolibacter sp.]|nr:glycosyltransferase [Flavisolibacter sp.]